MSELADTSILVSSLIPDDPDHETCHRLLEGGGLRIYLHAIAETFSTLTGGRESIRVDPATAAELIEQSIIPFVVTVPLPVREILNAVQTAHTCGVRGGAIYDFLHLAAARLARVDRVFTLNLRHFRSFHRTGDPEIVHP